MRMRWLFGVVAAVSCAAPASAQTFTYTAFNLTNIVTTAQFFDLSTLSPQPTVGQAYSGYTLSIDWAAGAGDPFSTEARLYLGNAASTTPGVSYANNVAPTAGAFNDVDPAQPTWTGTFSTNYIGGQPLFLGARQTYDAFGSYANWSSITLTLNNAPPPDPPASETVSLGGTLTTTLAANEVKWYKITVTTSGDYTFDTQGSLLAPSNDTELGLYAANGALLAENDDFAGQLWSSITQTLSPGDYYLAASGYNTVFNSNFVVTSTSTNVGTLVINGIQPVPEPASLLAFAAVAAGGYRLRRRLLPLA
jgi:hypothetical protein